jgi:hypothetical protein
MFLLGDIADGPDPASAGYCPNTSTHFYRMKLLYFYCSADTSKSATILAESKHSGIPPPG